MKLVTTVLPIVLGLIAPSWGQYYNHFGGYQIAQPYFGYQQAYTAPLTYYNPYTPPQFTPAPIQNQFINHNFRAVPQPLLNTRGAAPEYQGFSYHTDFNDGAKSTVVFFSGHGSSFAFNSEGNKQRSRASSARTLASDSLDTHEVKNEITEINNVLKNNTRAQDNFPLSSEQFKKFFEQTPNGVQYFYSFPTGPGAIASTTEAPKTTPKAPLYEAAESIQKDTRITFNDIPKETKTPFLITVMEDLEEDNDTDTTEPQTMETTTLMEDLTTIGVPLNISSTTSTTSTTSEATTLDSEDTVVVDATTMLNNAENNP